MKYQNIEVLNREALAELVDYITVYGNGNISVKFKFADELRKIAEYIEINTMEDTAVAGYPLCGRLRSNLCDEAIRDLQQPAHLHLAHTGIGYAHSIIKRRKGKRLLQQHGELTQLCAAEPVQDRQQIFLLFRQQHQPRPFPGGERSELRYGSTSRSLSVSVMQL